MYLSSWISALLMAIFALGTAHAMSCAPPESLSVVVSASEHIFVAQIKTSTLAANKQMIDATFTVEEILKGKPDQVAAIVARFSDYNYSTAGAQLPGGSSELSPGMRLLVFATGNGPALFGPCTYTTRLLRHNADLIQATRNITSQR